MGVLDVVGGILLIISCIGIIVSVVLQESPKGGAMSALSGSDSYYNRNHARTIDAILARGTKIFGIAFAVIAIAVYAIDLYIK